MIIIPSISRKDTVVRSAKSAIDYVLSTRDSTGKLREVLPEIIRGDPKLVRKLDNHHAHNGKNKSVSGVLALRDNERIDGTRKEQLLDRFLELTYGKMQDKIHCCIVEHQDKLNQEFHFISPNIDIEKNKRFNPYPVTRIKYKGKDKLAWQLANEASTRILNYEFNFEQVVEKKTVKYNKSKDIKLSKYSATYKKVFDKKETINSIIVDDIKSGIIKDRESLISTIKEYGLSTSRVGDDYITIVNKDGKKIRFKGGIYSKDSAADYQKIIQDNSAEKEVKSSLSYSEEQYKHDLKTVEIWHRLMLKTNDKSLLAEYTKHVHSSPNLQLEEASKQQHQPYKNKNKKSSSWKQAEPKKAQAQEEQQEGAKQGVSFNPKALASASSGGSGSLEGQVTSLISQLKQAENQFGVNSVQAIALRVQLAQALEALEKSKQAERNKLQA